MPIRELQTLLRTMEPLLREGSYVFVSAAGLPADVSPESTVWEPEGLSAVITRDDADRLGLGYDFVAAWITLTVDSALDAVGLTAAVSTALAGAGVSCNVIAGLRHDHLLVPVAAANDALRTLRELAAG